MEILDVFIGNPCPPSHLFSLFAEQLLLGGQSILLEPAPAAEREDIWPELEVDACLALLEPLTDAEELHDAFLIGRGEKTVRLRGPVLVRRLD